MKATEFAKSNSCDADWVRAMGDREVSTFARGDRGTYSGFPCIVKEHYANGMWNIQLASGGVCVPDSDIILA